MAPELEGEIAKGNVTVRDALAVRKEAPEVRKQAVDDVRAGRAKTAVEAVEKRTGRPPKAAPASAASGDGVAGMPPLPSVGAVGGAKPAAPAPTAAGGPKVGTPQKTVALPPLAYSPVLLLAGVRLSLGMIEFDPCSSNQAQFRVGAGEWLTREQDGMKQAWRGASYVFPPPVHVAGFASKLLDEMMAGRVPKAAFLGPAGLDERWAHGLMRSQSFTGVIIERERAEYEVEDDSPVLAGRRMALFLLGVDPATFVDAFDPWGVVLIAARD